MTSSHLIRISGLAFFAGAVAFIAHLVLRSVITASAGGDAAMFAKAGLWVPINALGVLGPALVLLGLPGLYVRLAARPACSAYSAWCCSRSDGCFTACS